jgi:uncharacterized protein (TIGR02118 family)
MVSLTAIYKTPENSTEFDAHYEDVHTPLVKKMEGLRKLELLRVKKMLTPPTSTIAEQPYLVCIMYFDDMQSLKVAMASEGGVAAAQDLMSFAGPLVSMVTAEVQEVGL